MKIRILDRILVALAGLLMLCGGAALIAQLFFGKNVAGRVALWLADENLRVYIIIAGILFILIGVYCVLLLFRRKGRNGKFIMQRTESGELAISLKALESMVQKCLEQHKELNSQAVNLENQKGSLIVRIRGTVAGGISIPLTVDSLQQQIKQYVTACSGIEVKDIRVEIESSGPDAKDAPFAIEAPVAKALLKGTDEEPSADPEQKPEEKEEEIVPGQTETAKDETPAAENRQREDELSAAAAAAALLMDKAPAEEDDRPMHQRLFSTVEEPCVMPMPPMNLEETAGEENKPEAGEILKETGEKTISDPENNADQTKPEETKTEEIQNDELTREEIGTEPRTSEETIPTEANSAEETDKANEEGGVEG